MTKLVSTEAMKDPNNWENVQECPFCGGKDTFMPWLASTQGDVRLEWSLCPCGGSFQNPRMTQEYSLIFYRDGDYREFTLGGNEVTPGERSLESLRAAHQADWLQRRIKPKSVLDLGCSLGYFLTMARWKWGSETVGVEPSNLFREEAIKLGNTVYESKEQVVGSFDLISMSHMLEHCLDYKEILAWARAHTKWLFVEVPNLWELHAKIVAHPLAFSMSTLEKALNDAGFVVFQEEMSSAPHIQKTDLNLLVLAR